MWTRRDLKERAKGTLRKYYWQAFVVALVLMIVGGTSIGGPFNGGGGSGRSNGDNNPAISTNIQENLTNQLPDFENFHFDSDFNVEKLERIPFLPWFIGAAAVGTVVFFIAFSLVWRVFLGYPVEVGCRKFFVKATTDEQAFNQMASYFNNDSYWNVVKTMFMRGLFNFLWYLALIIPGIVKSYGYSMVPYLLTDNPKMDYREAIELSQNMTVGHKLDMFVLDLSFIGWYLLGLLACGLGGVFVNPYYESTRAELYLVLRGVAIEKGICRPEQLNLAVEGDAPRFDF